MTTDPRIEAAAIALYNERPWRVNEFSTESHAWEDLQDGDRETYRDDVTVAIAAADNTASITTVEELDVLPSESVIHSEQGGVWERCDDGEVRYWITTGNSDEVFNSSQIALPARVIHWGQS